MQVFRLIYYCTRAAQNAGMWRKVLRRKAASKGASAELVIKTVWKFFETTSTYPLIPYPIHFRGYDT